MVGDSDGAGEVVGTVDGRSDMEGGLDGASEKEGLGVCVGPDEGPSVGVPVGICVGPGEEVGNCVRLVGNDVIPPATVGWRVSEALGVCTILGERVGF
jgi:hypothetical protein